MITKHTDLAKAVQEYKDAFDRYIAVASNPAVLPVQLAELDRECDQALEWMLQAKLLDNLKKGLKPGHTGMINQVKFDINNKLN